MGDCTNLHIAYPNLVYAFLHVLRGNREGPRSTEEANIVQASPDGNVASAAKQLNIDTRVRFAILGVLAETGEAPSPAGVAARLGSAVAPVLDAWGRLREGRAIVTGEDGVSILMANPFSGVPTEHTFESGGVRYYANCAWDALGIPAALGRGGTVRSRCANSGELLRLEVTDDGPEPCDWFFHSLVPAARWWDDIVFT